MLPQADIEVLENAADKLEEEGHAGAQVLRELIRQRIPDHNVTYNACREIVAFLRGEGSVSVRPVPLEFRYGTDYEVLIDVSASGAGRSSYQQLNSQNIFAAIARLIGENQDQVRIDEAVREEARAEDRAVMDFRSLADFGH